MKFSIRILLLIFALLFVSALAVAQVPANVDTKELSELQNKINNSQTEIQKIEAEIRKYEAELREISKKRKTLSNALREIEISRKKILNEIYLTEKQIEKLQKQIEDLNNDLNNKEEKIEQNKKLLAKLLRIMHVNEEKTFAEILLSNNFTELLRELENIKKLQELIKENNAQLEKEKRNLEDLQNELNRKKKELENKKAELSSKKKSLDIARAAQAKLVAQTKNKESNYQKLLAKKRKAKEEFEKQLMEYESRLKYILNPNSIPKAGSKVFIWPLDKVWITQYFGNTKFAQSGAYNGKGHNGIDLGTPIGTPVKAALSGVVVETGNTDKYPGCYSYGKWVLIKHGNGLATLYAHLSDIVVKDGQQVKTGQVIAYSGNTGYSTGPHLHFTVYAADAVKVVPLGEARKTYYCAKARVPVAPLNAYLNPMDFLP